MSWWGPHLALASIGLSLVAVSFAILRTALRHDPITAYRVAVIAIAACLALPIAQWAVQGRSHRVTEGGSSWWEREVASIWSHAASRAPHVPVTPAAAKASHAANGRALQDAKRSIARPTDSWERWLDRLEARSTAALIGDHPDEGHISPESPPTAVPTENHPSSEHVPPPDRSWTAFFVGLLPGLYLIGIGFCLAWQWLRWRMTMALLAHSSPIRDCRVLALWQQIAADTPRLQRVRLVRSDRVRSAACWGWFRPSLILPDEFLRRPSLELLSWALRHEFIHLKRGDTRVVALQGLLSTLFWFHPAAWWLSRQTHRLRELSCDEHVVRHGGRKSYALALLQSAGNRAGLEAVVRDPRQEVWHRLKPAGPTLLHWSRSRCELRRRIEMLARCHEPRRFSRSLAVAATTALLVSWATQLSAAASLFPAQDAAAIPESASGQTAPPVVEIPKGIATTAPDPIAPDSRPQDVAKDQDPEILRLRATVSELQSSLKAAEQELAKARSLSNIEARLAALEARVIPAAAPDANAQLDLSILKILISHRLGLKAFTQLMDELEATKLLIPKDAIGPDGLDPNSLFFRGIGGAAAPPPLTPSLSPEVKKLIADLKDKDPAQRWQAVDALARHQNPAIVDMSWNSETVLFVSSLRPRHLRAKRARCEASDVERSGTM